MKRLDLIINALDDMLSGWKYIRESHGDLYGVGWDRAESKAVEALAAARELREMEPVGMRYNNFGWNTRAFDEELFKRLEKYPDSTPQKLYALGDEK